MFALAAKESYLSLLAILVLWVSADIISGVIQYLLIHLTFHLYLALMVLKDKARFRSAHYNI